MKNEFLELLKYTVPALVVFMTAFMVLYIFMKKEYRLKNMELRMANRKDVLPMRFNAFERLSLFLERISFSNLLPRIRKADMTATELHYAIVSNIRMEFEHNLSQQIYVSPQLWDMITLCKDEMIKITNLVSASVPPGASAGELTKALFQYLLESEQALPSQRALDALKDEAKILY